MASTRNALQEVTDNVNESMGLRRVEQPLKLGPVSATKDKGRLPLRTFGTLEIERVIPDPNQPRQEFDDDDIQRFAESIRRHGQLHPIRVRWDELHDKWIIVSGERRWRATKTAGLSQIDCFFVDGELSEAEVREQQLVENLLRKDLNPLEEGRAYQSLMELCGWNGKQVAEAIHVTASRVSRALAMLDLPESVQKKVESGTLPKSVAYEISKLSNSAEQSKIASSAHHGLSHSKTVKLVRQRRGKKGQTRTGLKQVFISESGIKVTVTRNAKANYHEVEQALLDALEEVRLRLANNVSLY